MIFIGKVLGNVILTFLSTIEKVNIFRFQRSWFADPWLIGTFLKVTDKPGVKGYAFRVIVSCPWWVDKGTYTLTIYSSQVLFCFANYILEILHNLKCVCVLKLYINN